MLIHVFVPVFTDRFASKLWKQKSVAKIVANVATELLLTYTDFNLVVVQSLIYDCLVTNQSGLYVATDSRRVLWSRSVVTKKSVCSR